MHEGWAHLWAQLHLHCESVGHTKHSTSRHSPCRWPNHHVCQTPPQESWERLEKGKAEATINQNCCGAVTTRVKLQHNTRFTAKSREARQAAILKAQGLKGGAHRLGRGRGTLLRAGISALIIPFLNQKALEANQSKQELVRNHNEPMLHASQLRPKPFLTRFFSNAHTLHGHLLRGERTGTAVPQGAFLR